MTTSFIRRTVIALFATSVLSGAALSQAKETPPQDRFAKLDTMRVHYRNYGEGKDDGRAAEVQRRGSRVSEEK